MCDKNIHDELIDIEESKCPYCDELLIKGDTSSDPCCDNEQIMDIDVVQVCIECGFVHNHISKDDYIDFYENMFRMQCKSVYNRKYHIKNSIQNFLINHKIELTYKQREIIYKIFKQIGFILPKINENRKRIISINFIIMKILEMMNSIYRIPIKSSKRTMAFYNKYWSLIMSLTGDKIEKIVK